MILIFLIGVIIGLLFNYSVVEMGETPFSYVNILFNASNATAPSDSIAREQIQVFDDKIIIYVSEASISSYAPTGSMKPLFDEGSNGIRIIPESEEDIHVGDIISFYDNGLLIVHRVVEKEKDEQGVYFITKGDNNVINDSKIRFKDIEYKTVGVMW